MLDRKQHRFRLTYEQNEEARYVSHLDILRAWERALRRAGLPLAYSKGHSPHPRITFAAALAVGFTSDCETVDVLLERPGALQDMALSLSKALPPGLVLRSFQEVPIGLPALQAQMRKSEYQVHLPALDTREGLQGTLERLLAAPQLVRRRRRKGSTVEYDLRPLVDDLWLDSSGPDGIVLGMRLLASSQATARPDEVLDELGLAGQALEIRRTRLIWDERRPVGQDQRRREQP